MKTGGSSPPLQQSPEGTPTKQPAAFTQLEWRAQQEIMDVLNPEIHAASKALLRTQKEFGPINNALKALREREKKTPDLIAAAASVEKIKSRVETVGKKVQELSLDLRRKGGAKEDIQTYFTAIKSAGTPAAVAASTAMMSENSSDMFGGGGGSSAFELPPAVDVPATPQSNSGIIRGCDDEHRPSSRGGGPPYQSSLLPIAAGGVGASVTSQAMCSSFGASALAAEDVVEHLFNTNRAKLAVKVAERYNIPSERLLNLKPPPSAATVTPTKSPGKTTTAIHDSPQPPQQPRRTNSGRRLTPSPHEVRSPEPPSAWSTLGISAAPSVAQYVEMMSDDGVDCGLAAIEWLQQILPSVSVKPPRSDGKPPTGGSPLPEAKIVQTAILHLHFLHLKRLKDHRTPPSTQASTETSSPTTPKPSTNTRLMAYITANVIQYATAEPQLVRTIIGEIAPEDGGGGGSSSNGSNGVVVVGDNGSNDNDAVVPVSEEGNHNGGGGGGGGCTSLLSNVTYGSVAASIRKLGGSSSGATTVNNSNTLLATPTMSRGNSPPNAQAAPPPPPPTHTAPAASTTQWTPLCRNLMVASLSACDEYANELCRKQVADVNCKHPTTTPNSLRVGTPSTSLQSLDDTLCCCLTGIVNSVQKRHLTATLKELKGVVCGGSASTPDGSPSKGTKNGKQQYDSSGNMPSCVPLTTKELLFECMPRLVLIKRLSHLSCPITNRPISNTSHNPLDHPVVFPSGAVVSKRALTQHCQVMTPAKTSPGNASRSSPSVERASSPPSRTRSRTISADGASSQPQSASSTSQSSGGGTLRRTVSAGNNEMGGRGNNSSKEMGEMVARYRCPVSGDIVGEDSLRKLFVM